MARIRAARSPGGISRTASRPENFRDAADFGRDQRLGGGAGLQDDIGQGFATRRHHHHFAEREGLARRHRFVKADEVHNAARLGARQQRFAIGVRHPRSSRSRSRPDGRRRAMASIRTFDAFDGTKFADVKQIGRGRRGRHFREFAVRDPVADDLDQRARLADPANRKARGYIRFRTGTSRCATSGFFRE